MSRTLVALTVALFSIPATAQQEEEEARTTSDGRPVIYDQRQEIIFGELVVGGTIDGPELDWPVERTPSEFELLFHVRTDFNEELAASPSQVK